MAATLMTPMEMDGFLGPAAHFKGDELRCFEWDQLEEGDCVIVQRDGGPLVKGKVDVVTDDGSIFWVLLDGGLGRISIYADEGTRVWLPEAIVYELPENPQESRQTGR